MKILFLNSPAFAKQDMLDAFTACNIQYDLFFHNDYHERQSPAFEVAFLAALEKCNYDLYFLLIIFQSYLVVAKRKTQSMFLMSMTVLWWHCIPAP